MRLLMLFRPRLPGQRAQSIQTVHMAEAFARAGLEVTLLADRGDAPVSVEAALARFGLQPLPTLDLRIAPTRQRGLAGLWFRRELARWWRGPPGVVYARDLRRLVQAVEQLDRGRLPRRHRLVVEVHGQGAAAGHSEAETGVLAVEAAAARWADAIVANCEGTASAWAQVHGVAPTVAHNATAADRLRGAAPSDGRVRVVGSLRAYKGWSTIWAAVAHPQLGFPLEVVGGRRDELSGAPPTGVAIREAIAPHAVPELLARSSALILPLADNRFGRELTSPLKLWDYLATATPLVLPDLPSVHRALACVNEPVGTQFYRPGDPLSLCSAVEGARRSPRREPVLRSWDDRVQELMKRVRG